MRYTNIQENFSSHIYIKKDGPLCAEFDDGLGLNCLCEDLKSWRTCDGAQRHGHTCLKVTVQLPEPLGFDYED